MAANGLCCISIYTKFCFDATKNWLLICQVHKSEKPEETINKKQNFKPKETKNKTKLEASSVHELCTKNKGFSST